MPEQTIETPATPEVKTPTTSTNGAAAAATPAKPAEPTRSIKINGKEVQVTDAQLIALAQKGYFADQKLNSFNTLKTKTESLINALKTPEGLMEVLRDPALGASPKEVFRKLMMSDVIDDDLKEEMSKWVYDNVVQQAKKTPEEIERDKKLSEYERLKKESEERRQQELTAQQQKKIQDIYQAIRSEVSKQILADKSCPQTEPFLRQVIEKLRVLNRQGAAVTIETVAKARELAKKDFVSHQQVILDALEDPESLISAIGEARALKISRALVARIQAKAKEAKKEDQPKPEETKEKVTDKIDHKLGRERHGYTVLNV